MDYTVTLTEVEKKAMEYVAASPQDWIDNAAHNRARKGICLLYTSPSPRDLSTSRMPSSA